MLDFNGRMPKFFMDSIKTNIHKREEVYIKEFGQFMIPYLWTPPLPLL